MLKDIDENTENTEIVSQETKDVVKEEINEKGISNSIAYDTLVLSGGSAKGILTLGALQYAIDNFLINDVVNYIGTSAGAIIGYLLIIGYTPIEIMVYICTHRLMEKLDNFNVVGMMNGTGAMSFSSIYEILEKMTISKIGKLLTMKDINDIYHKNFICTTYNMTTKKTEYISSESQPDLPCLTALRMSSNLPLIFEQYRYNGSFYIDGGVSDNFSIDLGDKIGKNVLGLCIDIEDFRDGDTILEYIYELLSIQNSQNIDLKIKNISEKCKVVKLSYPEIKILKFNIDSSKKLEIFSHGYQQMKMTDA